MRRREDPEFYKFEQHERHMYCYVQAIVPAQ